MVIKNTWCFTPKYFSMHVLKNKDIFFCNYSIIKTTDKINSMN